MMFDVEIVLRDRAYAVTERILHTGNAVPDWNEEDVEAVLTSILLALDRVKNPDSDSRHVATRVQLDRGTDQRGCRHRD